MEWGRYRLTKTIKNPVKADGRRGQWYYNAEFREGSIWLVRPELFDRSRTMLTPLSGTGMSKTRVSDGGKWWEAIMPHLERIEVDSFADLIREAEQVYRISPVEILEELERAGAIVTLESAKEALSTIAEVQDADAR